MGEIPDMEEQLKLRMWAGEYWEQGHPIVRLLADMAISATKQPGQEPNNDRQGTTSTTVGDYPMTASKLRSINEYKHKTNQDNHPNWQD